MKFATKGNINKGSSHEQDHEDFKKRSGKFLIWKSRESRFDRFVRSISGMRSKRVWLNFYKTFLRCKILTYLMLLFAPPPFLFLIILQWIVNHPNENLKTFDNNVLVLWKIEMPLYCGVMFYSAFHFLCIICFLKK